QPRDAQPLFAGGVELSELGDGGHLTQQPQGIEAALLDRAGRPRQLRGPAELALDLLDELADLGGGGFRLLALAADEGHLVFLIIEQDVENTVGYQRDTDHRDEQRDVLREQSSAGFCDRRFGYSFLLRVSTCVLIHALSTHEWLICGHPVPAERLRPDDQIRSVSYQTPRIPRQSPSRARRRAHVRTKR